MFECLGMNKTCLTVLNDAVIQEYITTEETGRSASLLSLPARKALVDPLEYRKFLYYYNRFMHVPGVRNLKVSLPQGPAGKRRECNKACGGTCRLGNLCMRRLQHLRAASRRASLHPYKIVTLPHIYQTYPQFRTIDEEHLL